MTLGVALPSPHPLGPGRLLPSMFVPNNPSLRTDPTANTGKNTHHPKLPHLGKSQWSSKKIPKRNLNVPNNIKLITWRVLLSVFTAYLCKKEKRKKGNWKTKWAPLPIPARTPTAQNCLICAKSLLWSVQKVCCKKSADLWTLQRLDPRYGDKRWTIRAVPLNMFLESESEKTNEAGYIPIQASSLLGALMTYHRIWQ